MDICHEIIWNGEIRNKELRKIYLGHILKWRENGGYWMINFEEILPPPEQDDASKSAVTNQICFILGALHIEVLQWIKFFTKLFLCKELYPAFLTDG